MKLLEKTWLIFLTAMFLGFIYPDISVHFEPYLTLFLIILMTISTRDIEIKKLFGQGFRKAVYFTLGNYLLLGIITVIPAMLLIKNQQYFEGLIVMAAVPCAIGVIPLTKLVDGNTRLATRSLLLTYAVSLILTPVILWLFFKQRLDPLYLLSRIFLLAVLPIILSRILKLFNHKIEKYEKVAINIIYLVSIYSFVGLNRDSILNNLIGLNAVIFILVLRTFVLTIALLFIFKKLNKINKDSTAFTVFATNKNLGYATLLALSLFGREAAIPTTIALLLELLNFIIYERLVHIVK